MAVIGSRHTLPARRTRDRRAVSWLSTTCPDTTGRRRKSCAASPRWDTTRSARTCIIAKRRARGPTTRRRPRARGGVPDERLVGDVGGAAAHLRLLPSSNRKVGVIGYCSGGRQSVLAACSRDLNAAVDCYGAYVVSDSPQGGSVRMTSLVDRLPEL